MAQTGKDRLDLIIEVSSRLVEKVRMSLVANDSLTLEGWVWTVEYLSRMLRRLREPYLAIDAVAESVIRSDGKLCAEWQKGLLRQVLKDTLAEVKEPELVQAVLARTNVLILEDFTDALVLRKERGW